MCYNYSTSVGSFFLQRIRFKAEITIYSMCFSKACNMWGMVSVIVTSSEGG